MGKFSDFLGKIPFLASIGSNKKTKKSNVELQYDKALNLMENGNAEEAVEILEQIVDIAVMDPVYKDFGIDSLKILGHLFEFGKHSNCTVEEDKVRAIGYYEKYIGFNKDGEMI